MRLVISGDSTVQDRERQGRTTGTGGAELCELADASRGGESLAMFPEGAFTRVRVIRVALRGMRSVLRDSAQGG